MFENNTTTAALSCVKRALEDGLEKKYKINNPYITNQLLRISGLHKSDFDTINRTENIIERKNFNNGSIDDNSNKSEKSVSGVLRESTFSFDKLIGLRYLYRELKKLYGKSEANRLTAELYDFSLGFSDSTKVLIPYCWAMDATKIVLEGRPFGQLKSKPPKRLASYIAALSETIHQMSSHVAGALAVSSIFYDSARLLMINEGIGLDDVKNNKEIRKYVENCFQSFVHSVNHLSRSSVECVTEDTKVLTPQGLKGYNELNVGDDIYTWNNGKCMISKVKRVNVSDYEGEMHRYKGRDLIQEVTPNHRVLRKKYNTDDEFELIDSSKIIDFKTPITFPVSFREIQFEDFDISDDLLKLLTIILCDGHIKVNTIQISKSTIRNGHEEIKKCLNSLGIEYTVTNRESTFSKANFQNKSEKNKDKEYNVLVYSFKSKDIIGILNNTRKILPEFFTKLSCRQSNIVIDTWKQFDGHCEKKSYNKTKLQVDNDAIAEQLLHLCVRAGKRPKITERLIGANKTPTKYVCVHQRKNKDASVKERFNYSGKVWCPTTDDGIVMFVKDGSTFVSGNSPFSNVTVFDRAKLKTILEEPNIRWYFNDKDLDYVIDYVVEVQKIFLDFFDKGDPSNNGLPIRFPVVTCNISKDGNRGVEDTAFLDDICNRDISKYNIFASKGTKVASCCRVINDFDMLELASQSNSFGGVGSSIGSHRVVTINFNRIALESNSKEQFFSILSDRIESAAKILKGHKTLIKNFEQKGLQPFISNGWINMDRLFSTFGILGIYESVKTLKTKNIVNQDEDFTAEALTYLNKRVEDMSNKYKIIGNIEQIPAESFSHRLATADSLLFKGQVEQKLYANQFVPLWEDASIWERMETDGKYNQLLTGGGICHLQITDDVTPTQAKNLISKSIECGCEHFALNKIYSICSNGHVTHQKITVCDQCGSTDIDYITRVVGFFTPVSSWKEIKKTEDFDKRKFVDMSVVEG